MPMLLLLVSLLMEGPPCLCLPMAGYKQPPSPMTATIQAQPFPMETTTTKAQLPSTETTPEAQLPSTETTPEAQLPSTETTLEAQLPSTETTPEAQLPSTETTPESELPSTENTPEAQLPSTETTPEAQLPFTETTPESELPSTETTTQAQRPSEDTWNHWNQEAVPGSRSSRKDAPPEPASHSSSVFTGHAAGLHRDSWSEALIPHRPALAQVILTTCVVFGIALIGGLTISFLIYRLTQAEEKQQLALLYENIRVPVLEDEEQDYADSGHESTCLLPENQKELGNFIHSVIRSKRKKYIENKRNKEVKASVDTLENAMYSP